MAHVLPVTLRSSLLLILLCAACDSSTTGNPAPNDYTQAIALDRKAWYPASLPIDESGAVKAASDRAGFLWYNIEAERGVHRRDLDPTLSHKQNTLVQSMDIDLDDAPAADDSVYAGIMRGFPGGGIDISEGQLLEVWINDFKPDPLTRGGKVHIDLGLIDELDHVDQLVAGLMCRVQLVVGDHDVAALLELVALDDVVPLHRLAVGFGDPLVADG